MKLLLINTDRSVFTEESAARRRISLFRGGKIGAIDTITFSTKKHALESQQLADGVHAYPTDSFLRLMYGFDAWRVAKKLSRPDVVSAQDPFETGLAALLIARYWKAPLVVEMHTDFLFTVFCETFSIESASSINRRLCASPRGRKLCGLRED